MPKFAYQAKNASGKVQVGQIDAANESEARVKLRTQDLTPVRLALIGKVGKAKPSVNVNASKKISSKELQIFTRQFSTLVNAGVPIVEAIKILEDGSRNPILKEVTGRVRESIEGGKRLGESMAVYPGIFDRLYVNMVRAGEEAGILDGILDRLSIYMEKSQRIKGQVKGAMVYPAAIIFVAILVITGMLVFIIPKFQEMYISSGKALPMLTQMVVNLSNFLVTKYQILIIGIFSGGYFIYTYIKTPEGKKELDKLLIGMPVIGDVVQKAAVARMSRTLETLLRSGVGVIDALDIASRTSGNVVIEEALLRSKEFVTAGRPLAFPLSKEKAIPDMVSQMISIGEKSGTLDAMFGKIADFYEDDIEVAVKAMTSMIDPILMVGLGGVIAVLVLAMYLPIFDMASLGSQ